MTPRSDEPRLLRLEDKPWSEEESGVWSREANAGGERWAVVEYEPGAGRSEWCEAGHRGYVMGGRIEYEFDDGREPLAASAGEAFRLPAATAGDGAHRGRNPASAPARLFLIDDPAPA